jgi:hypothetical protein
MEYSAVSVFQMKAFLGSRIRCRSQLAVALVCVAGLGNVRMLPHAVRSFRAAPPPDAPEVVAARFEPLCCYLPVDAKVGFLPDRRRTDAWSAYPDRRLFLAQYALAPRLLDYSVADRWVIVDSEDCENRPETALAAGWTLAADLHNGVRLYTTRGGE